MLNPMPLGNLCLIFGDQLNRDSLLFDDFDPQLDCLWMAETLSESTHVPSNKQRSLLFLAAMRHFAEALRRESLPLEYRRLDDHPASDFTEALAHSIDKLNPQRLRLVLPGDYRVLEQVKNLARQRGLPLDLLPDNHFIAEPGEFSRWAQGKKQLRMEYWYRQLRKRTGILMKGGEPLGGEWNYDKDNRRNFGKQGPSLPTPGRVFAPDAITLEAAKDVERWFGQNPGQTSDFAWPVTRDQALCLLEQFISDYLPFFGDYQDAMWTDQPWLYHSRLSAALNLKLLNPREVIAAAEMAFHQGRAPLNAVEGFIRQILGWREYVRGLYWTYMPQWSQRNHLEAQQPLPDFYWHGEVDMHCLRQSLAQVIHQGYGHHIQRLMVTGLFALLWQVEPQQIHAWYLAMYVDAVEWVELPNVLGMSQYADGGIMASKPYIASGRYIARMSHYCAGCKYRPELASGDNACPFTTLYWAFLDRHSEKFAAHPRLALQVKNLKALNEQERQAIAERAEFLRKHYSSEWNPPWHHSKINC